MKPLIIIFLLTAAIITAGCLTLNSLADESARLDCSLSELEKEIENMNWEAAAKGLKEFHDNWDRISKVWTMLIDHYEIDNIELAITELDSYIKSQEKSEALAQLASVRVLIKHIPAKEALNLSNLF
jgi:deoxyadenosine/deoxycytidine kinase